MQEVELSKVALRGGIVSGGTIQPLKKVGSQFKRKSSRGNFS
jgi:hypothetical protein